MVNKAPDSDEAGYYFVHKNLLEDKDHDINSDQCWCSPTLVPKGIFEEHISEDDFNKMREVTHQ